MQQIDIFPWDNNFNVNIQIIDEQHRKLVGIINDLAASFTFYSEQINLATIFDELVAYTDYHFKTEEAIWAESLGAIAEHRNTHSCFIDMLKKLILEQQEKSIEEAAENTLDFLVQWLVAHILESDRFMSYAVSAVHGGKSLQEAYLIAKRQMKGRTRLIIDVVRAIYRSLSHNTLRLMRELVLERKLEQELRSKENLLRIVIDEMPDVLVLKDDQGNYILENKAGCCIGNWCDKSFTTNEDIADYLRRNLMNIVKQDENQITYEDSRNESTGEMRHFKLIKKSFKDTKDKTQTLVLAHDITEEIRNKNDLQRQRGFLKTLIQTIPDLIWLKDEDGVYLACNPRFEEFFGAAEAEIVGKTDYDFVEKELADFFREHDKKAVQKGSPTVNEEWISFASDGHRELLETTKTPMYDDSGKILGILGIGRNITERKNMELALRQKDIYQQAVLDNFPFLVWLKDVNGRFLAVNKPFALSAGLDDTDAIVGKTDFDVWPIDLANMYVSDDKEVLRKLRTKETEEEVLDQGMRKWFETYKAPVINDNGEPLGTVGFTRDISDKKAIEQKLHHVAYYDSITDLPNRLLLSDRLQQAIAQSKRRNTTVAVVYLDLDGFKAINDNYGHDMGDRLLVEIAKQMKQALREGDTISRLGGDEFVAVLQDIENIDEVRSVLERLRLAACTPTIIDANELKVSASIGVAFYPQANSDIDADQLIRQSDQAMYQAKQSGKNRYHIFDPEHDRALRTHHESLERIRKALQNNEFELYYQPKVNMRTGKVIGVEALIRWRHPDMGILSPAAFLSDVEHNPLIIKIGDWVLESAMKQIEIWHLQGIDLQVSINVNGMQLQQKDFVLKVQNLLKLYPAVRKGDLQFEILETSALEEIDFVVNIIYQCRELGIDFALDDFGTGYSSLTYLKRLPAKTLKIDQSFIFDILDDSEDLAITEGIIKLADTFGREIIAEGVESVMHGVVLLLMGCEMAQGYVIAKPMDVKSVANWISNWMPPIEWRQQKLPAPDSLLIVYAVVAYREWTTSVIDYAVRQSRFVPELDMHKCKFGKWLYRAGKNMPSSQYNEIVRLYEEAHKVANLAVDCVKNNKTVDAKLRQLEKMRDEITQCLLRFLADVPQI